MMAYLHTGSVSFRFREDDFVAVLAGGFAGGSFAVIVSSAGIHLRVNGRLLRLRGHVLLLRGHVLRVHHDCV